MDLLMNLWLRSLIDLYSTALAVVLAAAYASNAPLCPGQVSAWHG